MRKIALMSIVMLAMATAAQAGSLWGTTMDQTGWTGGEIFTVDTMTGVVDVKRFYSSAEYGYGFGDIAVSASGDVFVTAHNYDESYNFTTLLRANTTDWSLTPVLTLDDPVNALQFVGDTLYGITGGDMASKLVEIPTNGDSESVIGVVGAMGINSDGDIAYNYDTGKLYATFWDGRQGGGSAFDQITLSGDTTEGMAFTGMPNGVAGFAYDKGTFYAASYYEKKVYTVDIGSGVATEKWNLSTLSGGITGLSAVVPEPLTMLAVGSAVAGLGGYIRRRRRG